MEHRDLTNGLTSLSTDSVAEELMLPKVYTLNQAVHWTRDLLVGS